jgi:hypothetical protein
MLYDNDEFERGGRIARFQRRSRLLLPGRLTP